eukprot:TRINITY_DN23212_c0_g1_i1.p1 TRINITY_DN23212_c0_g1~~TRINITY_DN23212_c0_g1_i1.p1  ORF type:complete len:759 (-),score=60.52 TRINITY_DN23212_c0_g1_i1:255-2531(-)
MSLVSGCWNCKIVATCQQHHGHTAVCSNYLLYNGGLRPFQPRRQKLFSLFEGGRFGSAAKGRGRGRVKFEVVNSDSATSLLPLGLDFMTFLATTVLVVPLFKSRNVSPILGFLFAGLILDQLGLFRNVEAIEKLSELGVLFLLFEMGLELSLDRLKSLAKFAFGLGSLQMIFTTLAFMTFALPVGKGFGTQILVNFFGADPQLVSIRSVDEALVIGAALSLSSSAFVLRILQERGELATTFGSATLGILLFQDIATIPFLVLLPLIESDSSGFLLDKIGPTAIFSVVGVALLLLGGRTVLRRIFEIVANSRSQETFLALSLLTVVGASYFTQKLGFSDTLGAFIAGVLLSETNFRSQIEADIQPFKGILLGLFFVTTGSSIDTGLLAEKWPVIIALCAGLIGVKTLIIGTLAPYFGLSKADSARTAFALSQGGEFAFVLLSLASQLKILPIELNRLLIIVVVLSMAVTPWLADLGRWMAEQEQQRENIEDGKSLQLELEKRVAAQEQQPMKYIVICGFGQVGQVIYNMLTSPLSSKDKPVIAFDMNPRRVRAGRENGMNVMYGEGWKEGVLEASQIEPCAVIITYSQPEDVCHAVMCVKQSYPDVKIYAVAQDVYHAAELRALGAGIVQPATTSTAMRLGRAVARDIGMTEYDIQYLSRTVDKAFKNRVAEMAGSIVQYPIQDSKDLVLNIGSDGFAFSKSNSKVPQQQYSVNAEVAEIRPNTPSQAEELLKSYSETLEGAVDEFDEERIDDQISQPP